MSEQVLIRIWLVQTMRKVTVGFVFAIVGIDLGEEMNSITVRRPTHGSVIANERRGRIGFYTTTSKTT